MARGASKRGDAAQSKQGDAAQSKRGGVAGSSAAGHGGVPPSPTARKSNPREERAVARAVEAQKQARKNARKERSVSNNQFDTIGLVGMQEEISKAEIVVAEKANTESTDRKHGDRDYAAGKFNFRSISIKIYCTRNSHIVLRNDLYFIYR